MRNSSVSYKVGLILIVLSIPFACEKEKGPTNSPLGFYFESFQSGCKDSLGKAVQTSGAGSLILSSFNDTIRVFHANAYYNCCTEIKTDVVKTRLGFDVSETEQGDSCDCMCYLDVTTFICNLYEGTYLIRVFDTAGNLIDRGYVIVRPGEPGGPGEP